MAVWNAFVSYYVRVLRVAPLVWILAATTTTTTPNLSGVSLCVLRERVALFQCSPTTTTVRATYHNVYMLLLTAVCRNLPTPPRTVLRRYHILLIYLFAISPRYAAMRVVNPLCAPFKRSLTACVC